MNPRKFGARLVRVGAAIVGLLLGACLVAAYMAFLLRCAQC